MTNSKLAPTAADGKTSAMMSKMTVGQKSTVSRRSKAVPVDSLFNADVESVKARNERTGDAEAERFGRWALRQEAEKARAMQQHGSKLDPIKEVQQRYASGGPPSRGGIGQRGKSISASQSANLMHAAPKPKQMRTIEQKQVM